MKVFFVIKALNGIAGGAERVLCVIASKLAERGHDVTILSFDHDFETPFYELSFSVKRRILGCRDPKHNSTLPEILSRIFSIRKATKSERPDIVIGFMHSIFVPLAFGLAGSGIPVIASEHIVPQYYKTRRSEFYAMILSGLMVRKITVLSDAVRRLYPKILHGKMVVVPNPVSILPNIIRAKKKIILNVGRLDPQKDQKTLIEAFALLAPGFPDWSLRIVGEGPLRQELEQLVQKYDLVEKISLPGKNSKIEEEYAQAEIFAIPSCFESFGLATAEALSFSLPAIGFADCPGTNEIILDGQNGILVGSEKRIHSLAEGLRKLMASESYRHELGKRGPESLAQYHPDVIASIWEDVIDQAL